MGDFSEFLEKFEKWDASLNMSYNWESFQDETSVPVIAPRLLEGPTVVDAVSYAYYELNCLVYAYPAPEIKWYIATGRRRIAPLSKKFVSEVIPQKDEGTHLCTLKINYPNQYDSNAYICKISNSAGTIDCKFPVYLPKNYSFLNIMSIPAIDYIGKSSCKMHVNVSGVSSESKVYWRRIGRTDPDVPLPSNGLIFRNEYVPDSKPLTMKLSLTMNNFGYRDTGIYVCYVKNIKQTALRFHFPLIYDPRSRDMRPEQFCAPKVALCHDGTLIMIFWITTEEIPYFRWRIPNGDFIDNNNVEFATSSSRHITIKNKTIFEGKLKIHNVETMPLGTYRCLASNGYGSLVVPFRIENRTPNQE